MHAVVPGKRRREYAGGRESFAVAACSEPDNKYVHVHMERDNLSPKGVRELMSLLGQALTELEALPDFTEEDA